MNTDNTMMIGKKATSFELMDEKGNQISLTKILSNNFVVLIFYPGDMTPGCTMQLCSIRDEWEKFSDLNTLIFGINHGNQISHEKFSNKYTLPFPLLIDKNFKISTLYGAVTKLGPIKFIKRTVIIIEPKGTIIYYRHGMPKNSELLKVIKDHAKKSKT